MTGRLRALASEGSENGEIEIDARNVRELLLALEPHVPGIGKLVDPMDALALVGSCPAFGADQLVLSNCKVVEVCLVEVRRPGDADESKRDDSGESEVAHGREGG